MSKEAVSSLFSKIPKPSENLQAQIRQILEFTSDVPIIAHNKFLFLSNFIPDVHCSAAQSYIGINEVISYHRFKIIKMNFILLTYNNTKSLWSHSDLFKEGI